MADTETAKSHLRNHLASLIIPPICDGVWSIQKSATELCERNGQLDQILRTFQNMLTRIPEWSDSTVSTEVLRIQKVTKCNYLDDLLMGVFVSYMKSFATLHYHGNSSEIKIDFDRPTLSKFVHELYIQSARKLWQVAYLFKVHGIPSEQNAKNRQEIENNVNQCLEQVIRSFLPWETIAKKYFNNDSLTKHTIEEESESESEDEEETVPPKTVTFTEEDVEPEDEERLHRIEIEDTPDLKIDDFITIESETVKDEQDPIKELEQKAQETLVLNL